MAATEQFCWPPAGSEMAASGHDRMAADRSVQMPEDLCDPIGVLGLGYLGADAETIRS